MNAFVALLERTREHWRAVGSPASVLAAVSGGADSVALMRVLAALRESEGFSLTAAHVDHGLRAESSGDVAFTRALCAELNVPCDITRLSLSRADENAAREARYAALYASAAVVKADVVALAHHADDQAETMLMRLARGCGADGLAGMASLVRAENAPCALWRPFLEVSRDALRDALSEIGQAWREDESNADDRYFRNRVRRHMLPILSADAPGAAVRMSATAALLADENDCLNVWTERFLAEHASTDAPCVFLETAAFDALHIALKRRALRALCARLGMATDHQAVERALRLREGEEANLPRDFHALRTRTRLHVFGRADTLLPLGRLEEQPFDGCLGDGKRLQAAPLGALEGAMLRHRLPGDFIRPLGMAGEKSLTDYLIDRGVDRPFRDHLPLLCREGEVLWVIGVGASERLRVRDGQSCALYRYIGKLPQDTKEEM